jgi:hypothetical protein
VDESRAHADHAGATTRLLLLAGSAIALAAVDLDLKATLSTPQWAYHHRAGGWFVLCVVTLVAAAALARVPSKAVALGGGVMSGGVLGNLVSAHWNGGYVPDPIILGDRSGGVAFNLADIFTLLGIFVLIGSLIVVAIRNRDRLLPSTRVERWLLRRLGL